MPTHPLPLRAPQRPSAPLLRQAAAWAAAWVLAWAPAAWAQPAACPEAAQVGVLGTVIGQGHIHAGAHSRPAERGAGVCVGERIETSAGGHVHIRFVDGALVSVRPSSRLHIEAYPQAAAGPVRFRLEAGVVRAVSGEFSRTQREQFRLNTPLAAIGIKGTDFVVRADAHATRATVHSGAIVVAPLAGACALAPQHCPDQALTLSADMSHLMIELSREHPLPRLLPALDLLSAAATTGRLAPHPSGPHNGSQTTNDTPPPAPQTSQTTPPAATPNPAQLQWVRSSPELESTDLPPSALGQRFEDALLAGLSVVVGNQRYTLFRDERTLAHFNPPATSASFTLTQGEAQFHPHPGQPHQPQMLHFERGQLQVDFARSSFATQLDLRGPSISSHFAASGTIGSHGLFDASGEGHALAGALATDASQAAYFFSQSVPHGHISGITLWGR